MKKETMNCVIGSGDYGREKKIIAVLCVWSNTLRAIHDVAKGRWSFRLCNMYFLPHLLLEPVCHLGEVVVGLGWQRTSWTWTWESIYVLGF